MRDSEILDKLFTIEKSLFIANAQIVRLIELHAALLAKYCKLSLAQGNDPTSAIDFATAVLCLLVDQLTFIEGHSTLEEIRAGLAEPTTRN